MGLFGGSGVFGSIGGLLFGDPGKGTQIPSSPEANRLYQGVMNALGQGGEAGVNLGIDRITEMLTNPGKLDPRLRLRQEQSIMRGTAAQQQRVARRAARRGMAGSQVSEAINAALGAAGQGQLADLNANEARLQEQLRRQDIATGLGALQNFFVSPALTAYGTERGVDVSQAGINLGVNQLNFQQGQATNKLIQDIVKNIVGGMGCWVAREIYGADNPKWLVARDYILNHASDELRDAYLTNGPALAARVKADPSLKAELKPIFDNFIEVVEKGRS